MSDAGFIAIVISSGVTVLGAAAGAGFSSFTRRRDDQARRTGERIGALEKQMDYERGRQAGLREAREEASKRSHGQ